MTIFKTFLKVCNKNKFIIILYTVILVIFGGLNMQMEDNSIHFTPSKPNVVIVNQDEAKGVTQNLIEYISDNSHIISLKEDEQSLNDALFYRDVHYIIYIPPHYRENFLNHQNPTIQIKSTGDYQAAFAEMMLERYLKVTNIYNKFIQDEGELIEKINQTLLSHIEVEMTSKLDTNHLTKASFYFNFANYSILAGLVYMISLILSSFKEEKIRKRTVISSMDERKYNRILFLANCLFALVLWGFYVILSFFLVGKMMFTAHGFLFVGNFLLFTICAVAISFLIGTLVKEKNALNGIVNVVALGSSFLCGAFVPMEYLPNFVIKVAHVLPSYYYIKNNELLAQLETFDGKSMMPIFTNMCMILLFILILSVIINIVSKKNQKIG